MGNLAQKVFGIEQALMAARKALKFYGDLKYSHTMGFPCEVQWVAENTIAMIDAALQESGNISDKKNKDTD